jgi:hypothetical protein
MKKELNTLLSHDETKQIGFNGFRHEDKEVGLVFQDNNGNDFSINPANVDFIINFADKNLPSSYYREHKVFTHSY